MKLKKLSASEFDRVARLTGMEEQTIAMAREVLVFGRKQTEIAAETGVTKQRIFKVVVKIEQAYFNSESDGGALVSLDLHLPEKLALELASISAILESRAVTVSDMKVIDEALAALVKARQVLEA